MVKNIFQWPPLAIIYINNKKKNLNVHCMVYRPSQGHKVTLGSTRNIQCTTPNQFPTKEILWVVLISNNMARNIHHEWCVSRTLSSKSHWDRASEGQPTGCHVGCSFHKEIWLNHAQYMYFIQPKKKKVVPTHRQHKVAQLAACSWWPCSA